MVPKPTHPPAASDGPDPSGPRPPLLRRGVWDDLQAVARPDSRFHMRFSEFIPDFEGSEQAVERLLAHAACRGVRHAFVTPDNSLVLLRQRLLAEGVGLVVSSYNMARGFWYLAPGEVPPALTRFAAWLDGLEHFGVPLTLKALAALGRFDLVATGAAAVATSGVRYGRGHGWFDLEWRLFGELGLVDDRTPIVTLVHEVQVLEQALYPSPDDVLVDHIVTPARVIDIGARPPRPRRIDWSRVDEAQVLATPALRELRRAQGLG